jgi:hypothetical protein
MEIQEILGVLPEAGEAEASKDITMMMVLSLKIKPSSLSNLALRRLKNLGSHLKKEDKGTANSRIEL